VQVVPVEFNIKLSSYPVILKCARNLDLSWSKVPHDNRNVAFLFTQLTNGRSSDYVLRRITATKPLNKTLLPTTNQPPLSATLLHERAGGVMYSKPAMLVMFLFCSAICTLDQGLSDTEKAMVLSC
jgi:hypothetical protein